MKIYRVTGRFDTRLKPNFGFKESLVHYSSKEEANKMCEFLRAESPQLTNVKVVEIEVHNSFLESTGRWIANAIAAFVPGYSELFPE